MLPIIRLATPADIPQLAHLERACPMSGATTIYISRHGDYTRVLRFFQEAYIWVAVVRNKIVGSISWSWRRMRINGSIEPLGWLADLRIDPDYRNTTLAFRLFKQAHKQAELSQVDVTVATVVENNDAVESLTRGRVGFPRFEHLSTFYMLQILPGLPVWDPGKWTQKKKDDRFTIRYADTGDLAAITGLLNTYHEFHQFWDPASPDKMMDTLAKAEGMKVEDYVLLERQGHPVAVVHTWDQDAFKKPVIISYSRYLAFLTVCTRFLNRFTKIPSLPPPGGVLRYLWLRDLACYPGQEEDLQRLVRWLYQRTTGGPHHFLMVSMQVGDRRMQKLLRGLFYTQFPLGLWGCSLSGRDLRQEIGVSGRPLFHDFTLT